MTFSQPWPRGCTPAFSLGSFCQQLHPVGYKPSDQGVFYHGLCPLGYQSLSNLVGITCFGALLWCARNETHQSSPPVWAICGFYRWAYWPASQLFHRWYFPIELLSYVWLGSFFAAARYGHPAPAGAPHLLIILLFMMFGLPFLHFLSEIISPMQFVLQSVYIVMVNLVKLFFCLQAKLLIKA